MGNRISARKKPPSRAVRDTLYSVQAQGRLQPRKAAARADQAAKILPNPLFFLALSLPTKGVPAAYFVLRERKHLYAVRNTKYAGNQIGKM